MSNTLPHASPPRAGHDGRTPSGSNHGDAVPASAQRDPSRGAALERDALPPDADFSHPPSDDASAPARTDPDAQTDREERIRGAAYERYLLRGGGPGSADTDWLEAESCVDAEQVRQGN